MRKKFRGLVIGVVIIAILGVGITVFANSKSIEAVFKNIKISINGNQVTNMDVEPFIYNNRTFVPIRFIIDNLGMKVNYNNTTDTVEILGNNAISTTSGSSAVDIYKNNTNLFIYISKLKKVNEDLTNICNNYIDYVDATILLREYTINNPKNMNLTLNLFNSTQTAYRTILDKHPNFEAILNSEGNLISKKQLEDIKGKMDLDLINVTQLIKICDTYSTFNTDDNKNLYINQNKLTLDCLTYDSSVLNKYYDQLSSELTKKIQ